MLETAVDQPFWSVMITAYNRDLVAQAIRSVLVQDQGPERMQIQVVDDASPDCDIAAIVREVGKGRVEFHRNPKNIGLYPNCNVAVNLARGKWVHILHDDDVVYPGFYQAMESAERAGSAGGLEIGAAYCRPDNIDEHGKSQGPYSVEQHVAGPLPDFHIRSILGNPILFPGMVVKKSVYEALNGFDVSVGNAADWVMWARIAQKYAVWYEPRILAGYRRHSASVSSELFRTAADIAGISEALDYFGRNFPHTLQMRQALEKTRENTALLALKNARDSFRKGDLFAGTNHLRQGLLCSSSTRVSRELQNGVMQGWDEYVREALVKIRSLPGRLGEAEHAAAVRTVRLNVARQLLDAQPHGFQTCWNELVPLLGPLLECGLRDLPLEADEVKRAAELREGLKHPGEGPDGKWPQYLIAASLFFHPSDIAYPPRRLPEWLAPNYVQIMLKLPGNWPSQDAKQQYADWVRQSKQESVHPAPTVVPRVASPSFSTLVAPWTVVSY